MSSAVDSVESFDTVRDLFRNTKPRTFTGVCGRVLSGSMSYDPGKLTLAGFSVIAWFRPVRVVWSEWTVVHHSLVFEI